MIDHVQLAIRYGRIYSLMHRVLDRRMVAEGASLARTKMLHYIANNAPVRAADVAEWFDLAPRTVTQAIDTMERDALVIRVPDLVDRRAKRLDITDKGRQVLRQTEPLRRELIEQAFSLLTEEDFGDFARILDRLELALETRVETGPGAGSIGGRTGA
ncbi:MULTISPECIES: MarR family winged helix-turn-helix transcriptional regulator [Sphingomonas]|jgi:DNA-binding MarR family transcriptional regulator|uniref:Winged helix-turn-helix transcriptional regulator n=1 Tax=Sphingomonas zeae TaxID=1646122 RepID=A0A7Y6B321_9SPHN|nr:MULTISPECIES: MarR family winged helix-turn-helix transcriptional regulator [Sphingomonas]MBB4047555.1 DNA-binding MarR family transcriptional regulator [Sphingomonas zeae]MDK8185086.1 MarR family winged helix-turn-helix transcriptional regulator [Sphingomonas zeae]MDK8214970.1 MarR family winged helix-turn-helix transcriptional regulator [Sphingomonas sp. UMB7805-LC452B]NUU46065.1 winged helix-turn-helix transcriptional regulator [Sphingomonas zeae]